MAAPRMQVLGRLSAAFAAGVCCDAGFAPFAWWPLAILSPAALFALIRGLPPRRAGSTGAAFGVGLFTFGTYWLYTCLHVIGLVPLWLTLLLQVFFVGVMATYCAAVCYFANRFWLKAGATRDWLVLPALWLLFEWLRGWLLTGFPWLSLGYALVDSPLKGLAPMFGIYGVTAAAVSMAVALNVIFMPGIARSRRIAAAALLLLLPAISWLAGRHVWTHSTGDPIAVAAVQGAVSQDQKWQIENRDLTMQRYLDLTQQAWGARLIVWPEAALPVIAPEIKDYLAALEAQGQAHGADFAIGLLDYDLPKKMYRNGILVLAATGDGWYYKRHLVPFGEYFPVPDFIRNWMRLMNLPYDDIKPGTARQPVLHAAGQTLGLTICFEDAFGSEQVRNIRESTLLINVTNNAWYGNSTAPHQHLQISQMRALEAGRYLVRAANDGITAVIGPGGEIIDRLPQFRAQVLKSQVRSMHGLTPYTRFGNYPVVIAAAACLAMAVWRRRRGH